VLELDADLTQSVLINLVDNASKASRPGQTVRLAHTTTSLKYPITDAASRKRSFRVLLSRFIWEISQETKNTAAAALALRWSRNRRRARRELRIESGDWQRHNRVH
jgi:K+-sensing histidine kinase KdpD